MISKECLLSNFRRILRKMLMRLYLKYPKILSLFLGYLVAIFNYILLVSPKRLIDKKVDFFFQNCDKDKSTLNLSSQWAGYQEHCFKNSLHEKDRNWSLIARKILKTNDTRYYEFLQTVNKEMYKNNFESSSRSIISSNKISNSLNNNPKLKALMVNFIF